MISTVLADDHEIVRQGIRALLEQEDHCTIIGETDDGLAAVELITELQPQLAVIDVQLPGLSGIEVARRVADSAPNTKVVILSMFSDEPFVLDALRHGASAYVLKSSAATDLLEAIHTVVNGKRYLSPPLAERAVNQYARGTESSTGFDDAYESLTSREREILQLAAQGMQNADIGTRLSISPRTVETHRTNINRKLDFHSHHELIRFALSRRLIDGGLLNDPSVTE